MPTMSKRLDAQTVTVSDIRKVSGIAGQVSVTATVTYEHDNGESETSTWQLVGNVNGGPVVAIMPSGGQTFVSYSERFGSFGADPCEYLRRFVLDEETW